VLFRNEDHADLATKVLAVLEDPAEGERLRVAGRRRAQVFDWSVVADEVMAVYETVVHGVESIRPESATDTRWTRLLRGRGRMVED
jgi:phosphatidyl-myo-inositol alpha-mannosyltransferase